MANIKLEQDSSAKGLEIFIRYPEMTEEIERIITMLRSVDTKIKCSDGGIEKLVCLSDIYYFESVDKMTFAYCRKEVYRTELRIYQTVADFAHLGFIQISKSCVLNINVLDSIIPQLNSRMELILKNGERLFVTRKYLENIKRALQEGV